MLTIAWLPLGVQRIYALITTNMPKSKLRKTVEALSDELTSAISRCDNFLSFYVYLLVGSVLFQQTLAKLFRRNGERRTVAPIDSRTRFPGVTADVVL
jgi:hypothetical protein